jgi:hypothetical protein
VPPNWGSYLEENVAAPVYKTEITAVGDPLQRLRDTRLSAKIGIVGWYSSLADYRCTVCWESLWLYGGLYNTITWCRTNRLIVLQCVWSISGGALLSDSDLNRYHLRVSRLLFSTYDGEDNWRTRDKVSSAPLPTPAMTQPERCFSLLYSKVTVLQPSLQGKSNGTWRFIHVRVLRRFRLVYSWQISELWRLRKDKERIGRER